MIELSLGECHFKVGN